MHTISARELSSIQVLGESKNRVLIVSQRNSNRPLVVKSEETTTDNMGSLQSRTNVGAMLEFHGTLFSKLRAIPFDTERLSLAEIKALRECSPNLVGGLKSGESWPALFDNEVTKQQGRIKAVVKISYVEQLANLNGMTKQLSEIDLIRKELTKGPADFMMELGQILAVDFFIGNHDRFSDKGMLPGAQNVFFSLKGDRVKATGIDTYDVFGPWSDLNKTVEVLEKENLPQKWPGRILAPGAVRQRDAVADTAVGEILVYAFDGGGGFKAKDKPIAQCTIGPARRRELVKIFHRGMSEAKTTLRKKYQLSDNLSALSAGISSRWKIIRG